MQSVSAALASIRLHAAPFVDALSLGYHTSGPVCGERTFTTAQKLSERTNRARIISRYVPSTTSWAFERYLTSTRRPIHRAYCGGSPAQEGCARPPHRPSQWSGRPAEPRAAVQPVCAAVMRESNRCDVVRHSRWPEHACVQVSRSALKLENLIKSAATGLVKRSERGEWHVLVRRQGCALSHARARVD